MTTLDFTSTSADGLRQTGDPLISVTTIIANLGSQPAVTIPLITGEKPDVNWVWDYLREPADFFGTTMPARDELRAACERFAASAADGSGRSLVAVTIMLIEANGRAQFVVTGIPAQRFDPTPVRIAVGSDVSWLAPSASDPLWRRMAARTTSRGDVDQLRRWLNGNGFADLVNRRADSTTDPPTLGALVLDYGDHLIGLDNPNPTSVLGLMERCGALRVGIDMERGDLDGSGLAASAWWISPFFDVHPVDQIGDARYDVEFGVLPIFLERLS